MFGEKTTTATTTAAVVLAVLASAVLRSASGTVFPSPESCPLESKTCDDFKTCCEEACPFGATVVCHEGKVETPPKPAAAQASSGFMMGGGGADPTETQSAQAPSRVCACDQQGYKPVVQIMTMHCIAALDALGKCPQFETCCKDTCAKHPAHAYHCRQEADGMPSDDTQCVCLNSMSDVPGFQDLASNSKGGAKSGGDRMEYEDRDGDCMNSSSTCAQYEECCGKSCQGIASSAGTSEPKMNCVHNSNGLPMKSTHTYCWCPKHTPIATWSDNVGAKEVSQIFKGGSAVDAYYDYGYGSSPSAATLSAVLLIVSVCFTLLQYHR